MLSEWERNPGRSDGGRTARSGVGPLRVMAMGALPVPECDGVCGGAPHLSEAMKCAALEGFAAGGRLARETRRRLAAMGVVPYERRVARQRPWGEADDTAVWRLVSGRGWSATAAAAFLNREEAEVRASLRRQRGVPCQDPVGSGRV